MIKFIYTPDIEKGQNQYTAITNIEMSIDSDTAYDGLVEAFKAFSLAVGYHHATIKQWIGED